MWLYESERGRERERELDNILRKKTHLRIRSLKKLDYFILLFADTLIQEHIHIKDKEKNKYSKREREREREVVGETNQYWQEVEDAFILQDDLLCSSLT